MRIIGGRTNVWGRQSYRLSQQDLKGESFDGHGADWPLNYDDLAPYYDLVEDYVGITGQAENVPELPDSKFLPPMALTCAETQVRRASRTKFGRTVTIGRAANLTKPHQRPRGVSLLRAVRARLRDAFLLQLGVHDGRRRVRDGQVHAHPERDGLPGDDGSGDAHGARGDVHRSQHARGARGQGHASSCCARRRSSRRASCLNSSTGSTPNGLANSSGALGHYLHGSPLGRGRRERRVPGSARRPDARPARGGRTACTSSASATR